ncbi:MAG: DUF5107 domain-containing protein [Clostridiales bacterium]|nr:DUF5107 domain-containing protein [Clostridiales bacterium]
MRIITSNIILNGAELGATNPLPYFRDANWNRDLDGSGLEEKEKTGLGYNTGYRVLPYTIYDEYKREKSPMTLKTIVMENDNLRATFLADYGGRLYSLFDKTRQKELLYVNPVFQPCNIGTRYAWFSGGIEWNVGQYGHTTLTCDPMYFVRCRDSQGEEFLRMYEYERIKGVFLQIDFHLPDNEKCLYAHVNIFNSHDTPTSLYWWTNTAVEQNRHMHVLSGNQEIIMTHPTDGKYDAFLHDTMPKPKALDEIDVSYPENCPFSMEYFFQNESTFEQTWEAAAYDDGSSFFERSTPEMPYRKMFCWSNRNGGQHWQNFLSEKGSPYYTEIQSGIFPTQVHGGDMQEKAHISFTQAFGGLDIDDGQTHGESYSDACSYMYNRINKHLPKEHLLQMHKQFNKSINLPPVEFMNYGSGWGALEQKREPGIVPKGLSFPEETLDEEQTPFLTLLETNCIPEWPTGMPPSYMCDSRWLNIMEKAINQTHKPSSELLFHYGVASYENGNVEVGIKALLQAIEESSSPIISRTLGMLYQKTGDIEKAITYIRKAIENGGIAQSSKFAVDYLNVLIEAEYFQDGWEFYESLPSEVKEIEQIQVSAAVAAYEIGQWGFLKKQFSKEYVYIREGDISIVDLWYKYRAREITETQNIQFEEALKIVKKSDCPPYNIDFQLFSEYEEC